MYFCYARSDFKSKKIVLENYILVVRIEMAKKAFENTTAVENTRTCILQWFLYPFSSVFLLLISLGIELMGLN